MLAIWRIFSTTSSHAQCGPRFCWIPYNHLFNLHPDNWFEECSVKSTQRVPLRFRVASTKNGWILQEKGIIWWQFLRGMEIQILALLWTAYEPWANLERFLKSPQKYFSLAHTRCRSGLAEVDYLKNFFSAFVFCLFFFLPASEITGKVWKSLVTNRFMYIQSTTPFFSLFLLVASNGCHQ